MKMDVLTAGPGARSPNMRAEDMPSERGKDEECNVQLHMHIAA